MLRLVGQVAVDHVHDAAEQRDPQRLALGLVRGAVPHFVERARPSSHVEAADGPGRRLGPGGHLGHPEHRLDAERLTEVLQEPLGVRVQEERGLVAVADAGRLDLGLVDGTRPELEVLEDLVGHGELDRAGQLEAVAPDELGRRGHPSDEVVLLDTEHPHAAARHDGGGGQPVVPCSDDDGVVVRHLPEDCSDRPDCSPDCFEEAPRSGPESPPPLETRERLPAISRDFAILRHPCGGPVRIPDAERASCPFVQAGPHSRGGRVDGRSARSSLPFRSGTRRVPPGCRDRGLALSASGFAAFGIAVTAIGTAGAASSPCLSHLSGDDGGADGPAFWRPRPSALLKGAAAAERLVRVERNLRHAGDSGTSHRQDRASQPRRRDKCVLNPRDTGQERAAPEIGGDPRQFQHLGQSPNP